MSYINTLNYLNSLQYFGIKFGLNNIKVLLDLLGNPHNKFKAVHIAGTNGKGSVAAFTGSIAALSGYKVGVYTSPHLVDFRERIAVKTQSVRQSEITEKFIPKTRVISIVSDIKRAVKHMRNTLDMDHPTYFEIITALAFKYFADENIDILICETGMGGRLDATNVCNSIISVITNVELEHTDVLGNRTTDIAYEKACIIKKPNVVISGSRKRKVLDIISNMVKEKKARLVDINSEYKWGKTSFDINRQTFWIKGHSYSYNDLEISLLGEHQITNAVLAVAVAEKLRLFDFKVHENAIKTGLSSTIWQGRFQVLRKNPLLVCDGAHNPSSARVLKRTISEIEYDRLIFIVGILKEKNYRNILRILLSEDSTAIFTNITGTDRALNPEILLKEARKFSNNIIILKNNISLSLEYAFQKANKNDLICVTGSLYLVGELLKGIKNSKYIFNLTN
ncbi:bifunctional folylpolyglutamate synthase/dihydrofolate synthase [bacterium]|nr:bifunctional folylpolyglutamate synthase/dihydrofolate synthase [bacterium]